MAKLEEIYISTDIETNGPIPSPYSILSIGSAAFLGNSAILDTFSANFQLLPDDPGGHPDTMDWWATQPDAWEKCRANPEDPTIVMKRYVQWVEGLGNYSPVFVAF